MGGTWDKRTTAYERLFVLGLTEHVAIQAALPCKTTISFAHGDVARVYVHPLESEGGERDGQWDLRGQTAPRRTASSLGGRPKFPKVWLFCHGSEM